MCARVVVDCPSGGNRGGVTAGSSGRLILGGENIGGLGAMLDSFPVMKRGLPLMAVASYLNDKKGGDGILISDRQRSR
jgi:hypothetical protein